MFWPLLIGGGLGLVEGIKNKEDKQEQDDYRKELIKYSPWTGMQDPGRLQAAGPFGSAIRGASMGAMLGQMGAGKMTDADMALLKDAKGRQQMIDSGIDTGQAHGPSLPPPVAPKTNLVPQLRKPTPDMTRGPGPWRDMAGSAGAVGPKRAPASPQDMTVEEIMNAMGINFGGGGR